MSFLRRFSFLGFTALALLVPTTACTSTTEDATSDVDSSEAAIESNPFVCDQGAIRRDRPNAPSNAHVVAIRMGNGGDPAKKFDRWVMEFDGNAVPNYLVERQESARFFVDGMGSPMPLAGEAGISIGVRGASGYDQAAQHATYTGSKRINASSQGLKTMKEAALLGDFEGDIGWGIGLRKDSCIRVTEMSNPPRLVVDVQNDGPAPAPIDEPADPSEEFECEASTISEPASSTSFAKVAAVRVGAHNTFDRFVMEFTADSGVPSFQVHETATARFPTSGSQALTLPGETGLAIDLFSASGTDPETGRATYKGYKRYAGGTILREAGLVKDADGRVTWGLGLSGSTCFRSFKMANPPRLVVDVKR
ncbi:MAG: hypothetical protein U0270_14080 [Labilithrix sp.]